MSWLLRYRWTCPLVGVMALVVTVVTVPPVIDTLTTSVVPWTTSPLVGESRVIVTGVAGRWPSPPTGVGYGVGAGVPEGPSAVADAHPVRPTINKVRRTRSGRRILRKSLPSPLCAAPLRRIQQGDGTTGVGRQGKGGTQRIL